MLANPMNSRGLCSRPATTAHCFWQISTRFARSHSLPSGPALMGGHQDSRPGLLSTGPPPICRNAACKTASHSAASHRPICAPIQLSQNRSLSESNGLFGRRLDDHAIAIEAAAQEFIGGAPEIQPKTAVIEISKALHDKIPIGIEILRPLLE